MIEPVRQNPQRQRPHPCDGVLLCGTIDQRARYFHYLGNPASIDLLFGLYGERQRSVRQFVETRAEHFPELQQAVDHPLSNLS